jgi:hypothetical protein
VKEPAGSAQQGIREWIAVVQGASHFATAVFDTRIDKWWAGSAAKSAGKALARRGFTSTPVRRSFTVTGSEGPLASGELERARRWGRELAGLAATGLPAAGA